jgi:hypothetical protein
MYESATSNKESTSSKPVVGGLARRGAPLVLQRAWVALVGDRGINIQKIAKEQQYTDISSRTLALIQYDKSADLK